MINKVSGRIRVADYLTVAQLFLKDNFWLERPLIFDDIKPRLLGHWGTCHGINYIYANLKEIWGEDAGFSFVLGPGHGFPALQANLYLDGLLDESAEEMIRKFSWPDGSPSHANPSAPGVITEGGELGYALATAYGVVLGHPEKTVAVLLGDGEMETATAMASLNLGKLVRGGKNGKVLPILHLNGYKISGPTVLGRKSEREINEMLRGYGYTPLWVDDNIEGCQETLMRAKEMEAPFVVYASKKGKGGPKMVNGEKIEGNCLAHQIPLKKAKTDSDELKILEEWLKSYEVEEVFDVEKGKLK